MSTEIYVYAEPSDESRGIRAYWKKVSVDSLKEEFSNFISSVEDIFSSLNSSFSEYEGKEIELSLGLTLDGKIGFIGTGAGAEAAVGVKIKLVRN